jgi:hypothetical protein
MEFGDLDPSQLDKIVILSKVVFFARRTTTQLKDRCVAELDGDDGGNFPLVHSEQGENALYGHLSAFRVGILRLHDCSAFAKQSFRSG